MKYILLIVLAVMLFGCNIRTTRTNRNYVILRCEYKPDWNRCLCTFKDLHPQNNYINDRALIDCEYATVGDTILLTVSK